MSSARQIRPSAARQIGVSLAVALVVMACGTGSAGQPSAAGSPAPAATSPSGSVPRVTGAPPSPSVSASPAVSAVADPSAPTAPSAAPTIAATAVPSSPPSLAATPARPPVPHAILAINEQNAYRGILGTATWSPAGPGSTRTFGKGVPAAAALRSLTARIGSVLTFSLDSSSVRTIAVYVVPVASFTGTISTANPFAALRFTNTVKAGDRVSLWAPAAGEWVLYARIVYARAAGEGTYFWRLAVR